MSLAALQDLKRSLIRKGLNGSVFHAPSNAPTVDVATLFDPATGDLVSGGLPDGYGDLGLTTTDGAQWARSVSSSDIASWQSREPSRSDVTADTTTLQVTCQETKLRTLGLWLGVEQDVLDNAGANGVVRFDQPETPDAVYCRAFGIAADQTAAGEIVICRYMPNAKVTSWDTQAMANGDSPFQYPMTLTGYKDDNLGFAHSWIFGGAGWKALLDDMGFTFLAVPVIESTDITGTLPTAGGTMVEIVGTGFRGISGATAVKFAGTNATAYKVVDDEHIVATAPAHAAGAGPLVVTNTNGPSTTGPTVTYA